MLNEVELQKVAEMIPAKTPYAVIASWVDVEETADEWDDMEHVHYCNDWAQACDVRRMVEREADGLIAYIIEPEAPFEDIED